VTADPIAVPEPRRRIEPTTRAARWLAPSLPDLLFVILLVAAPLALGGTVLNADGDLARHLRVGETILAEGAIPRVDRFSWTMAGRPFVPYEWLSEVAFAGAHRAAGLPAVVVLTGLLFATAVALNAAFLLRRGADPLLAYLAPMAGALLASTHVLARPHLFTMVGASALLLLLEPSRRPRLWPFAVLFALWANLHGGFLFGLVLLAIYAVGDLLESRYGDRRAAWRERLRYHASALVVSVAACGANPSGLAVYGHVTGYLRNRYLVDTIAEYQSLDFHTAIGKIFLLFVLGAIAAFALARERPALPRLLAILAGVAFALHSGRNVSLFGLTALPLLALSLEPAWRRLDAPAIAYLRRLIASGPARASFGAWSVAAVALMAAAAGWDNRSGGDLLQARFDPARFPVAAVERARAAHVGGRIYNSFAWGGYLLWAWPEQRVFIDGQVDFYGESLTRTYMRIEGTEPGWREAMEQWGISTVLVPTRSKLAYALLREPEWEPWYCDSLAVLLLKGDRPAVPAPTSRAGCGARVAEAIPPIR